MAIENDIRRRVPPAKQLKVVANFVDPKNPIPNSQKPQIPPTPNVVPYGEDVSADERAIEPVYEESGFDLASPRPPSNASRSSDEEGFGVDLNTLRPREEDDEGEEDSADEDEGSEEDNGEGQPRENKNNSESKKLQEETLKKAREAEAKRLAAAQPKRFDIKSPDQDQTSQPGHQNAEPPQQGTGGDQGGTEAQTDDSQQEQSSGEGAEETAQGTDTKSPVAGKAADRAKSGAMKKMGAGLQNGAKATGKAASAFGKAIWGLYTNPATAPWAWGITAIVIALVLLVVLISSYISGGKERNALRGTGGPVIETRPISDDDALTKLLMLTGDASVQTELSKEKTTQIIVALDVAINDPAIASFTAPDPTPADPKRTIPLKDALEAIKAKFVAADAVTDVNQRKTDLLAAVKALQALSAKLNPWCPQVSTSTYLNVTKANDKLGLMTGWFVRKDGAKIPVDNTMCQFLLFVEQSKDDTLLKENNVNTLLISSIVGRHTIYVSDSMNSKNRAINAQYGGICARCENSHTAECDQKYAIPAGLYGCQMSQHAVGRGLDISNLNVLSTDARQKTEAFGHWVISKLPELTAKKILIHQLIIDDHEWVRDNVDKTGGSMLTVTGHKNHTHIGFGNL